jgi:hypothetical protein
LKKKENSIANGQKDFAGPTITGKTAKGTN